jgi:transcriptional regulator of acetoin/glycerol metabolism
MAIEPPRVAAAISPAPAPPRPSDEAITEALRAAGGNIARASRALGMHRNQLYRRMAQRGDRNPTGEKG